MKTSEFIKKVEELGHWADSKTSYIDIYKDDYNADLLVEVSKVHHLKILPKYFDLVKRGIKNFEVRKNDRDFKVGDMLELLEWDEKEYKYTGRNERRKIIYILNDTDYCKKGFIIMGLKDIKLGHKGWV